MKGKKIVIANWKMNLTIPDGKKFLKEFLEKDLNTKMEVVICPSFIDIYPVEEELREKAILVGAQNVSEEEEGNFTGEVSILSLKDFAQYVIVGHSERRNIFGESDKVVSKKAEIVARHGLIPIICVGETLHEKEDGLSRVVTLSQVEGSLKHLTETEVKNSIIAYEPVWAIGSGEICSSQIASEMAGAIRGLVKALYGEKAAESVRIIYGGSVNSKNAGDFKNAKEIDGLLVGGASTKATEFYDTIKNFEG